MVDGLGEFAAFKLDASGPRSFCRSKEHELQQGLLFGFSHGLHVLLDVLAPFGKTTVAATDAAFAVTAAVAKLLPRSRLASLVDTILVCGRIPRSPRIVVQLAVVIITTAVLDAHCDATAGRRKGSCLRNWSRATSDENHDELPCLSALSCTSTVLYAPRSIVRHGFSWQRSKNVSEVQYWLSF